MHAAYPHPEASKLSGRGEPADGRLPGRGMAQLTVDGVARRFNPPQTHVTTAQLAIPVGEAEECGDWGWTAFNSLTPGGDFQDTVPADLP